jgi:hypothetical protein
MSDVRNKYGDVVYRIEGDRINDVYGNWKFTIVGDRINDTYGNWKYQVRGDYIFDTNGNRLGEKKNLAEILGPPSSPSYDEDIEPVKRELPNTWWGCLFTWVLLFLKLNWGGKIGVILGIIITIAISASGDMPGGNAVIIGVIITVVLGIIGTIIGAITKKKDVDIDDL